MSEGWWAGVGGGPAVLRTYPGRGGDNQKLETKPRSLQDDYYRYKTFRFEDLSLQPTLPSTIEVLLYCISSAVVQW